MSVVVRLLGPVEVLVGETIRPTPGTRRKAVLARLALRPGEVVGVDRLIDAVWGDDPPATAQNTLQSHVSYLRRVLEAPEVIVARPPGYALSGTVSTDLAAAEKLIEDAQAQGDPGERLIRLDSALKLWRGRPLADVADLSWFGPEADRLERIRRDAHQAAVKCKMDLGMHAQLVPELESLTARHPFDEDLQAQLVIALYRNGRQADALALLQRVRGLLRDELGIDLSPQLRDLESAVLRQDPGLDLGRTAPGPASAPRPRPTGGRPALVERAEEIELIDQALERTVSARSGSVLLLEGSAGIGKTSLLSHAVARATSRGFTILTARGTELETDHAWGCADQLLLRHGGVPAASGGGGEYPIINAMFWTISDLASQGPLLILLDDLHWADAASVRFLAFLAARLDALPVVLAIATRPAYERLNTYVSVMAGLPFATTRVVQPLTLEGSAGLLASVAAEQPDQRLVRQCHDLCRGNPFLMKELVRHLESGDALTADVPAKGSPSLVHFVTDQLRPLPALSVKVVRALAVVGEGAASDRLAEIVEADPAEVLEALAPPLACQLVVASDVPIRFSFAHPLIRRTVYDTLPVGLRTAFHLKIVDTALRAGDQTLAASHLLHVPPGAGGHDPVPLLRAAAETSLARGSVDSAVSFLRRMLEEDLGDQRPRVVTELGMAEVLVDTPRAIERLADALSLEQDAESRAQIAEVLASAMFLNGRVREAVQVCKAALEREAGASHGSRQALQALIIQCAYGSRSASDLKELVGAYAGQQPETSIGGLTLQGALAIHALSQNQRPLTETYGLEVIRTENLRRLIAAPLGDQAVSCAWYALIPCDSPRTLPALETAIDHYKASGTMRGLAPAYFYRGAVMHAHGYLNDALTDLMWSWESAVLGGMNMGKPYLLDPLLQTLVAMGETEKARSTLAAFKAEEPSGVNTGLYLNGEVAVHLAAGDVQRAFETLLAGRDDCQSRPLNNPIVSNWRAPMVHCLSKLGRHEDARVVAHELLDLAEEWATPRAVGRALRVAASVEPADRGLEMSAASVRMLEDSPNHLELAESRAAHGKALARAGRRDDALFQLHRALELAALCGALPLRNSITAALHKLGDHPFPRPVVTALTPAERKVAELTGAGLTARDVAAALAMTVNAVQRTVQSIEAKATAST
ncbi:hypothetical protein GCM10027589_24560 [Actinocorallia lasiicapitis]